MDLSEKFIVQYIGFKTKASKESFNILWTPFASQFKAIGIKTIDLYEITNVSTINFISRNVWDSKIYLKHFPSGLAVAGGGGGISVTQFGGYWLREDQQERDDTMKLLFLNEPVELNDPLITSRLRVSDKVPYKQMLDFQLNGNPKIKRPAFEFVCSHIKRM